MSLSGGIFVCTQIAALDFSWVLQHPWSSALQGCLLIDLDGSYGPRSGSRLVGGSWQDCLQPPLTCVALVCRHLAFFILSPHRGTELRRYSRPLFFLLVLGKTPSVWNVMRCIHMCIHPTHWTQERDASAHIRVWSSDAVSWLSEIKVSSSQLPSPPH